MIPITNSINPIIHITLLTVGWIGSVFPIMYRTSPTAMNIIDVIRSEPKTKEVIFSCCK